MKTAPVTLAIRPLHFQIIELNLVSPEMKLKKPNESLKMTIGHNLQVSESNKKQFIVEFMVNIENVGKTFSLSLKYRAFFESKKEITEEILHTPFMQQSPPAIAFPYLRSFILTITTNAGIDPIMLPPLNFTKVKEHCLPKNVPQ